MKKILIISLIFLASSQTTFAYVQPIPCGSEGNCEYKHQIILSKDVIDLQNQVDQLNKKNLDLEFRILKLEQSSKNPVVSQPITITTMDVEQNNRLYEVENKVGTLETFMSSLKTAIDKTISLLTQLLGLIK